MEIINIKLNIMYIDYKMTCWKRAYFSEDTDVEKVLEILKTDGLDYVLDEELGFTEEEYIPGIELDLDPKNNDGYSTIEVYSEGDPVNDLIWSNGEY